MQVILTIYLLIGALLALTVIVGRGPKSKDDVSDAFILFMSLLIWPIVLAITILNLPKNDD